MKKITILSLHLGIGGIEKYISSLCKMLENDFEIEIISTYKVLDKPVFDFSDKLKITYLINDRPYRLVSSYCAMSRPSSMILPLVAS